MTATVKHNTAPIMAKLNGNKRLDSAEKVQLQQYISLCYGSLTTFNVLFRNKEDQFSSK